MAPTVPYTRGAHSVADGVWAYLQPDEGWGRSNAGLIASSDGATSLLVEMLFDLELTAEMLAALRPATPAAERIGTESTPTPTVTTANATPSWPGPRSSPRSPRSPRPPRWTSCPPRCSPTSCGLRPIWATPAPYCWTSSPDSTSTGSMPSPPPEPSPGELELSIGGRAVRLIEVGPAHTAGDVIVHMPDVGVVFTG